ncbi:LysR family transcriptional regulator [Nodosilinea sp. LEGE 06152]|uniref:LysR family transcriptional regulator n=1 Tax=Nodosilinea sp. LEGE 06152 TaxID=2777966 RepID=UPI00187E540D|nr:LysR family transcriptional regulator [Nodosilinea sp. LEGE 06152]MBE9158149.1 LysR family transcriptional regulator [Nodosilinea sp. LEGE 06152]
MKLSQLRILVAVAEQETFSEAALNLDLSQSAVSHSISALEDHLGVVLFSRGRYGARLTPVGDRIVSHARIILQQAEAIAREAELARGLQGGQVRIASFRSIAIHLLPTAIAQFKQRHPNIAVNLSEHDDYLQVERTLREGRADIGFTLLPAADDFDTWEVLENAYVALFPPDFKAAGPQITWAEVAQHPLIMPPADRIMMRDVYDHAQAHGYHLNVVSEVETDTTIVNLVAQGLGATILPRLAAEPIPEQVQVFDLPKPLVRIIGAAVLANGLHTPAIYAFLDVLKSLGSVTVSPAKAVVHDAFETRLGTTSLPEIGVKKT